MNPAQPSLPREPLDLPRDPKEIEAHEEDGRSEHHQAHHQPANGVKTLLAWSSPGRPFKKRKKEYYLTSLLLMLLVDVILFLFGQYLLMLVVASLVFVSFALATVPPHNFRYRISTEGVTIEDHFYLWQELYDFYFKKKFGDEVLHIRTKAFLPGELTITLGDITVDHVREVLLSYLPYREVIKPTFTEKSGDWLAKNFPLERS